VKNQKVFFDFLKVHNELGKFTKFWTSRPLFSWRNSHLKKVRADSAPPRPNRVKIKQPGNCCFFVCFCISQSRQASHLFIPMLNTFSINPISRKGGGHLTPRKGKTAISTT